MKMNKVLLSLLFFSVLLVVACTPAAQEVIEEEPKLEQTSDNSVAADTNDNGVADVEVAVDEEGVSEVTIDLDDVQEEVKEVENAEFCVPGETFTYDGEEGSIDADVIGLAMFKGEEFCKASSVTEIESPVGTITTDTIYYFDSTYSEYWIVTTTDSPMMPESQVNEIHLVDGEVVA